LLSTLVIFFILSRWSYNRNVEVSCWTL